MTRLFLACLAALASAPALAQPVPATVDTCFVPQETCVWREVAAIDAAQSEVRVQAYGFSLRPIIDALLRAHARGVDVAVLLDRSNERALRSGLADLERASVPVWIDHARGIAHVKAITIDRHLVIGGSYNFTAGAETRNVEDVTFVNSPEIAERFRTLWADRRRLAAPPERR
jgi:phosphatidylserine/phosphatidylglycerophosphate/cardiolipin synthase-like enzyme